MHICKAFWNMGSITLKSTGKRFAVNGILAEKGMWRTGAKLSGDY